MKVTISPSKLSGKIHAPASKSSMQRAMAAALIAGSESIITNPGHSEDDQAAIEIIKVLGAAVRETEDGLNIHSEDFEKNSQSLSREPLEIHCGESGLSIRMFTPIAALFNREVSITGRGSLLNRPMDFFEEILPQLGVRVQSNDGKLPLKVQGPLQPGDIIIDGSLSSQFLTGLIMAYSAAGANGVSIQVKNLTSRPYISLTLEVMKKFGLQVPVHIQGHDDLFRFEGLNTPKRFSEKMITYKVEGDWSGAAFLLVAGALAGPIQITGLDLSSQQADKSIVDVLMLAQAGISMDAKGIKIRPAELVAFDFDATHCPDLFPPLAVLASYCKGTSRIRGVGRLVHKESNRAVSIRQELEKFGIRVECDADTMSIHCNGTIKGATAHSHHDHRIEMALSVLALSAEGQTEIEEAGSVNKSYPLFYEHLKKLGAGVSLNNTFRLHE